VDQKSHTIGYVPNVENKMRENVLNHIGSNLITIDTELHWRNKVMPYLQSTAYITVISEEIDQLLIRKYEILSSKGEL
jgi:hypothetical protein